MRKFLNAFLSFGLATSIEKLLGFILLPIYTLYFSTEVFGVIDLLTTVLTIATVFSLLQLETALQRFYYKFDGLRRKLMVGNTYMLVSALSLFISIIISFNVGSISSFLFKSPTYSSILYFICVQLPFVNLSMLGLILLRFEHRNREFLAVILVKVILILIGTYIFVVEGEEKFLGVFYSQTISIVISSCLVTFLIRKSILLKYSNILQHSLFSYALPQVPARVGSFVLAQGNRFFMLNFLSLSSIGIYSVSLKLASSIQIVNTAFIMAWNPFMHSLFERKDNKRVFASVLPLLSGVVFLCVSIVALISKEVVEFITSEEFFNAYKYIGGLALFFALYILKEVVDIGPKILERTIYITYVFFVSVVVNLISLYFLTKYFELNGVVGAMVLTNLVLFFGAWYVSNKLYPIHFKLFKFTVLILPCLVTVFVVMLIKLDLYHRILIAILLVLYYSFNIKKDYLSFKSVQK